MPWYRIIKTVKGRSYAYLQRSYRVGGSVRTESKYLGPVGSAGDTSANIPHDATAAGYFPPAANNDISPPTHPKRFVVIEKGGGILLRFDPKANHIDPNRLKREYGKVGEWAEGLGVPIKDFPLVVLRKGKTARSRRVWFGLDRVVTVPKDAGRKVMRTAFGDALGHAFLDSVKKSNPHAHQVLAQNLEPTFRTTNRLLLTALAGGGEHSRFALSLQMHVFGRLHPVKGIKAEHVGISGYGDRKNWEDETAQIIGEIATKGYKKAVTDRAKACAEALAKERRARQAFNRATTLDRFTGKRRLLKRKLLATTAARMATEEAHNKLHIISRLIPEVTR